jgi:glycine/D-amino acid oxidase-like deaminating enzyme
VGVSVAWQLLRHGHPVTLIDPQLDQVTPERCGSAAALGVLMAQVFHRSSGRSWRLRQRSHHLWQQWLDAFEAAGHPVAQRSGLLLLAATAEELERQRRLGEQRQRQGIALELWDRQRLAALQPAVPANALGALHSPGDGQLDPAAALRALWAVSRGAGLRVQRDTVERLERCGTDWMLHGQGGSRHQAPWLVLCAGVHSGALLAPLGHERPMEPVLGQALELELAEPPGWSWPGVVAWRGLNLVPRPDLEGGRRCWLGATLEPGNQASGAALANLRRWSSCNTGSELGWLEQARVVRHWQGLRCRPLGRPAPLLEQLEAGLLLVSCHYRNGVLLAPASAEWACQQIGAGQ